MLLKKVNLYLKYLHKFVNIGYIIAVLADSISLFIHLVTTVNCSSQPERGDVVLPTLARTDFTLLKGRQVD